MIKACFVVLVLVFCRSSVADIKPVEFAQIAVKIGSKRLDLAHAETFEQRARGLMYRTQLCANCGMLFTFDRAFIASIWMKNTYIPLDLAYITETGEIVGIHALTPHDLTSVRSTEAVKYAIEMNQGWFVKNGVQVGDTISIIKPSAQ